METTKKRKWSSAEPAPHPAPQIGLSSTLETGQGIPSDGGIDIHHSPRSTNDSAASPLPKVPDNSQLVSVITRKPTACPACRKQKIKCVMINDHPPCKRCQQRGLLCSPNKTVQDLINDQTRWNLQMKSQSSRLLTALNEVRAALSLPQLEAVDEDDSVHGDSRSRESDFGNENLDCVEENTNQQDTLVSAPIRSLYEVTGIRDLQKSRPAGIVLEPDFISRGVITIAEAANLCKFYLRRLDPFFYEHLSQYSDIAQVRKTSTLLALTLCTVASLHDPLGSELYDQLGRELRSVVGSLMFRRHLGLEDVKALCMGAYWLSDMTSILSALVVRKATSLQYHTSHMNQPDTEQDGFQKSQMWLLMYLSNEQSAILQGAPSFSMGSSFIRLEAHMASPFSGGDDLRLISHIDLLLILSRVRELFGLDTTKAIPSILIPQLRDFNVQLDRWGAAWSTKLPRNKWLGNFPSEAVKLHWRFAKFYICSYVFRGLNPVSSPSSASTTLSGDLEDISTAAITTAISTLQLLIDSEELQANLVGVPHYFHTMFAFAAVFLLKAATRFIHVTDDIELIFNVSKQVLEIFRQCSCARQHLVHRIAQGLKKMIEQCESQVAVDVNGHIPVGNRSYGDAADSMYNLNNGTNDMQWFDMESFDLLSMPPTVDFLDL